MKISCQDANLSQLNQLQRKWKNAAMIVTHMQAQNAKGEKVWKSGGASNAACSPLFTAPLAPYSFVDPGLLKQS